VSSNSRNCSTDCPCWCSSCKLLLQLLALLLQLLALLLQHQLIFNAPLQSREGRLLMAIKRVQQLLDLQLAAAARSIAAGVAQQSPQWAWKAVLLGSLIEAQRTVAAVAGGSQPSSRPRGAAVAVEQPSACAQRLLQRLPKVLSSEGELQTNVWLRALHTAAEQGRCTMSVNSICIFG
jgi:hypothetical protein